MTDNFFIQITQSVTTLLTQHSQIFMGQGTNILRGLALILLVWFGVKSALSAAEGGPGFSMEKFVGLLMMIVFALTMLRYYSTPIPGIGYSFTGLFTEQGHSLASHIEMNMTENLLNKFNTVYRTLEQPTGANIMDFVAVARYISTVFMLAAAQCVVFAVLAFGFVVLGIIVLVGPIFIPFILLPTMEWVFWGWFKALIQYSFYPVIANAFVYVFGNVMLHFFDTNPGPYDISTVARMFVLAVSMLIAFIWGVLRVDGVVANIFSGRSGGSAMPGIGAWR